MAKQNTLIAMVTSFLLGGCTNFEILDSIKGDHLSSEGNGSAISCVSGDPGINQKKVRRLTSSQVSALVIRAYANDNRFRSLDYTAFSLPIADVGFTGEAEKTYMDEASLKRWVDSLDRLSSGTFLQRAPPSTVCRTDFTKNDCISAELVKYGRKLLRRPPSPEEIEEVETGIMKIKAAGAPLELQVAFLHKYLLLHPSFFYRTEIGYLSDNSDRLVELDSYEVASLLSYTILNDSPDDTLMLKADQGLLKNPSIVQAEAERLLSLPEAKLNLRNILMDFLKLNKVHTVAEDKFRKYTYDGNFAIPGPVRQSLNGGSWHDRAFRVDSGQLLHDAEKFIDQQIGDELEYSKIFSGTSFPLSNKTVAIYGLRDLATLSQVFRNVNPDPMSGSSAMVVNYPANAQERYGILTHPAYLAVHSKETDTGMVKRGVFFLEQLLCNEMPAATANVFPRDDLPAGYDATKLTSRHKFEIIHSQQVACFSCHKNIDNIGGSFENFDQTGYFQKTETFKFQDKWYTLNIDSSGKLNGLGKINISYSNTLDFIKKVQETPDFKNCVNVRLLEFINGERRNSANSCGYAEKSNSLIRQPSSTYKDLILSNIKDPNFFMRRTEGGE